ncbi:hypothetical protein K1728_06605 [Weissella confusa]|uniref:hypothetical protein n=1 Tax=Weissella confusa TaxID=1583 RepID=UPI001C6F6D74|nr:hypothetical protein [Weissella confusa]QYU56862.1 hypothetical protein K1728_06605 [Weissella confusa]
MIKNIRRWFNRYLAKYVPAAKVRYWQENNHVQRQRWFVFTILGVVAILFIHAKYVARTEPVNVRATQIGSSQNIGYNANGMSIKLDDAKYNNQNQVLMLELSGQSNNQVLLTGDELKITGSLLGKAAGQYQLIPTTSNHWTVMITDLPKTWGAVQVQLRSTLPEPYQQGNSANDKNREGRIRLVQSKVTIDHKIDEQSATKVVKQAVSEQIKATQKVIKHKRTAIAQNKKTIASDEQRITQLKSDAAMQNTSEQKAAEKSIETLQNDIAQREDDVKSLEKQVNHQEKILKQDQDKLAVIQHSHLPNYPKKPMAKFELVQNK